MGLEIIGAGLNYKASKKAAKAQQEGAAQASAVAKDTADRQLELQREIWEKQQADYKPYLEQGTWGINRLGNLMKSGAGQLNNPFDSYLASKGLSNKFDSSNTRLDSLMKQGSGQLNNPFDSYLASKGLAGGKFDTSNPAYQFQLKQGQQALDRSSAARGMGYSGAQMKASQEYGQGLAGGQFNTNNPAYQFQLKQGQQALDRSSAARGMGYSGAQMKAAQDYGQGLASQEYDKQYNRASGEFGDYFNRLAGLSQGGQQAANTLGSQGSNYASGASNTLGSLGGYLQNNLGQAANARASGYIGGANAINGGIQNMTDNAFRFASLFSPFGGK